MSTFLRTLVLTAAAVGAIACVPQDGYYGNSGGYADSGYYDGDYRDGGYTRIDNRYRGDRNDRSNSCRRAYNGVCDEGRYGGTNKCDDGTDTADCRGYASRDRDHGPNSCRRAYNGVCDEGRYGGTNRCTDGTDTADCTGGGWRRNRRGNDNDGWPFD
ncbi:hypothetical protein [Inquilinus sp.]|uniref:hypothetical protein n=1 Tax=Inquilinus sp. TaxID=1932117 RepID=UPI0031D0DC1E